MLYITLKYAWTSLLHLHTNKKFDFRPRRTKTSSAMSSLTELTSNQDPVIFPFLFGLHTRGRVFEQTCIAHIGGGAKVYAFINASTDADLRTQTYAFGILIEMPQSSQILEREYRFPTQMFSSISRYRSNGSES